MADAKNLRAKVTPGVWWATGLPLALLILTSGLLFVQVLRLQQTAKSLASSNRAVAVCMEVEARIREQNRALLESVVAGTSSTLVRSSASEARRAVSKLRGLVKGDESQLSHVNALTSAYGAWSEAVAQVTAADGYSPEVKLQLHDAHFLLERALEAIDDIKQEELQLRESRTEALTDITATTAYVGMPALMLLALGLGFNSRRQLLLLAEDFNRAMEGQLEAKRQIELQSWARERLVRLVAHRDDVDVRRLGRRLLEEMAELVGAEVGAFYYVQDEDVLRLQATYGLSKPPPETLRLGQGLVGAAAAHTTYRHIEQLPENYLSIESSVGSANAQELALVPCHHSDEVVAIVELGFVVSPNERQRHLLELAGEAMGVAIAVTRKRARLRELLNESRRQADVLQSQQEELRVANEELSAQTEALKAAHAQLEERKEELEVSNNALMKQRDELGEAQSKLESRAIELKRANRYKSEFLASMSHELRTPLNSLLILSKTLAENAEGNLTEEQVHFAQTIHAGGVDLLALINDVLDLSKIEAGAITLQYSSATLGELLRPVVRITEPLAKDRGLELRVEVDDEQKTVVTDILRVQQVLKNLASNACKFTPTGHVTISARCEGEQLKFTVEDTGVGIADEDLENIFEAFRQGEGASNRGFSGTGLGLSISRDLAKRLGGDVTVRSRLGIGSSFELMIPLQPSAMETLSAPEEDVPSVPSTKAPPEPPPSVGREGATERQALLLILDDQPRLAEMVERLSAVVAFECLVAHDIEQGLEIARRHRLAAVVLDAELNVGGSAAVERLQQDEATADLPLHVLVGSANADAALSDRSWRPVSYLRKPAEFDALRAALQRVISEAPNSRRVLVVEDPDANPSALSHLLALPGIEFVTVGTVAEATRALQDTGFACAVVDLQMPGTFGLAMLRELASNDQYPFPHVIIYTSRQLDVDEEEELRRYSDAIILKAPRSAERLLDEVRVFVDRVESNLPVRNSSPYRSRGGALVGKTVLLAEDDVRNVFAMTSVLEKRAGVDVLVARNGKEALKMALEAPSLDMVLMDIMMPEMDGLEAIRKLRSSNGRGARLPIIALTARTMNGDRNACISAGANDYVTKPIDFDKLVSLMKVWMPR